LTYFRKINKSKISQKSVK